MIKEFREFIMKGSVIDLAVAVIIGAAFGAIINSFVNDIIMPIIGIILGGFDFTTLSITYGTAIIFYGKFIQAIVNFLIIGLTMFLVVRFYNRLSRKAAEEPPAPSAEVLLLTEIRDVLKEK